jgi:UDP-2-acetamido-3-amino-2,3-dideoxy-glucuronate N-acetyltransferase
MNRSEPADFYIHPSSFIDDDVIIGPDTKIWHFSHIFSGSRIGSNSSFGQNSVIGPNAIIGKGVKAQNNISIYDGVIIEDDEFLGPSMVFTNVINPRSFIVRKSEYRKTLVKKGCSIGANVTIVCGVTIGEYALVGAGAVVTKDVRPFSLIVGNPSKQVGWVCRYGEKMNLPLAGKASYICPYLKENYVLEGDRVMLVSEEI